MMTTVHVHEDNITGPHGPVRVRCYIPAQPAGIGLVWLHGGAFCMGDLDVPEADWVSRTLAAEGITVVSVDYRLAVEGVHFPVPSDDVLAAWRWACSDDRLGVPADHWHLGGGSAGANLAASVALQVRDLGETPPRSTVLAYPVMHTVLPTAAAELQAKVAQLPAECRFTAEASRDLNLNYVGREELLTHPYAFPANADLHGLPPALIINCDLDDLRASGEAYGAALALAGVDVAVVREVGVRHGHLNEPTLPGAIRTVARIAAWLTHEQLTGEPHESLAVPALQGLAR
jgi:acetyl esterase